MKKKIALLLLKIAQRLSPESRFEYVDNYVARDAARAVAIGKRDITNYRKKNNCSIRFAVSALVGECIKQNRVAIYNTLLANKIFNEKVYRKGKETIVETRLKILVLEKKATEADNQ